MVDIAEGLEGVVAAAPPPVRMVGGAIQLGSTGRPVQVAVPADITEAEWLDLISYLASPTGFRAQLAQRTGAAHGLVLPR